MKNTNRLFFALLAAVALLFAAGCSDDDGSGSASGTTWTATFDSGWSYDSSTGQTTVIATADTTLFLASDGTFTWRMVSTNLATNATSTYTYSGTWSLNGTTLALTMSAGNMTYYGTYSDSSITITSVEENGQTMTIEEAFGGRIESIIFTRVS